MRVLWFTNTQSCYSPDGSFYNGGGWISSAEIAVAQIDGIELAVSFIMDGQPFKVEGNRVTYYPLSIVARGNKLKKTVKFLCDSLFRNIADVEKESWADYINAYRSVIDNYKPDVIHVWGSEMHHGLVSQIAQVPVVLHIQGILNPYLNAFLPPFVSWRDYTGRLFNPLRFLEKKHEIYVWNRSTYREREIVKSIRFFLGRTKWDYNCINVMNPASQYFYCSEILREEFYVRQERKLPQKHIIVTTISNPLYKGFDLVLKTANFLKQNYKLDFEWKCFGNIDPRVIEASIGISHEDVGVKLMGVASAAELKEAEIEATLYFHSSYIDNSPNSICEAQMLGLPVVSTNVGGISSLVEHEYNGYLVPANDPYQAAFYIRQLFLDVELNCWMGENGRNVAVGRHDANTIVETLIDVYNKVTNL